MADNFSFTEGSGAVGAADDVSSVYYPFVKLTDATLNSTTGIYVDIGAKANALRVAPANDITDGTYIGDIKFGESLPAGTNGIGKLTANSGIDIGDVDVTSIIPGVAATNLGKARDSALGGTDTGVMALAVRDDTLTTLTPADGDYVPLRVGSTGKLHVTDANITACNTGAVVISSGTVTTVSTVTTCSTVTAVTSLDKAVYVDDAAWTNDTSSHTLVGGLYQSTPQTITDGKVAPLEVNVNGSLRVTDANITACNTGAVVISSGTVTTVSTVTNLAQLGGTAITMDEGVHDAGTQRVTLATDDDGVLSLGIIDDWDATHASAASADGPQVMGAGYSAGLPTDVGADGDAARICTDRFGRIVRGLMPQNFQATFTSADAQAASPVKVKTASRKMYILSLVVSVDTAMNVQFQDDTGPTVLIEGMYFAANGGAHLTWPPEAPLVVNTNEDFDVITSGAGNISVTITGYLAV